MCVVLEHFACTKIASFQEEILKLITDDVILFGIVISNYKQECFFHILNYSFMLIFVCFNYQTILNSA